MKKNEEVVVERKESAMKDTWTFICLVTLSILYLFEIDIFHLSWLNGVAFVIIAVTLIPLVVSLVRKIMAFVRRRNEKKEEKIKQKLLDEMK